ncbi:AtpZ/AtpI family protein [Megasphaera vaginalis (ex Bordigoni et al. 2020)]|uniref:AtpZ/AtpI family protein n=1 Tax=Megasphaera vaginalis (ex Bordigoni et al. 2020) TaxID=2045301 RepID=UPI000C79FB7B|nr:AtpZ/AtpI family protein [Megasphaera vaginalis (ex Bordigoni et al. 2020)]
MIRKNGKNTGLLHLIAVAASLGLTLFVNIVVGVLIGRFIDGFLNSEPFGLIFCALLGAATGFWSLYKRALALYQEEDER